MENKNTISQRMNWIDLLKIVSAFLVVLQHSISGIWTSISPSTTEWKCMNFLFILSRSAVPLFFMCSGAGMLQKERNISDVLHKSVFKLVKLYVAWMIVYGFIASISLANEGLATFSTVRNAFMKELLFGEYFTWFMIALIGLYLITPFLSLIAQDNTRLRYFLLLSVLFTIVIPLTNHFSFLDRLTDNLNNFHMHFVVGYVLYYVSGYYISRINWKKQYTVIIVIALLISYAMAFLVSNVFSVQGNRANQEIYGEFAPVGFLINITIFALFKAIAPYIKANVFLKRMVSYGIGIYLIHPLFLDLIVKYHGLYRIAGAIGIYFACVGICFCIGKSRLLAKLFLNGN